MAGYDEKFITEQKNILENEKNRITAEIEKLDKYPDYGDIGDDNEYELRDYEQNQSIEDDLKIILEKIDNALAAIKKGTYGKCARCKKLIDLDRLKIVPFADVCVKCKNGNE